MAGPRMARAVKRDISKCGVHAGGCGQIVEKKDRSLDHIIPQAFFKSVGANGTSTDYDNDWNRQLMHRDCDNWAGGHVHGLPPFWCHCHYLQIVGKDLFVVVRNAVPADEQDKHLLLREYAHDTGNPRGLSVFTAPLSKNPKSWDKSRVLRLDDENTNVHYLLCVTPEMVNDFNRAQTNRVNTVLEAYKGAVPDYSERDPGYVYGKDLSIFNVGNKT